jgi:hypothetical protein
LGRELALLAPIILLAAAVYRPWVPTPFPIGDWGGMLSHLSGSDGFAERYRALMDAYTQDGRFFPGVVASWVIRWTLLGDNPVAWQWARFGLMTANIVAAFVFLRRVGCSAVAAASSLVLFVVSAMAIQSWVLFQIAEPDGLLFVLIASIMATAYRRTARPLLLGVGIAGSLVIAIFMKETYVIAVPFVLAIAACITGPTQYRAPAMSRRNIGLVGGTAAAVLICNVVPVLLTRAGTADNTYGGRYGLSTLTVGHLSNVFTSMFLPVTRLPWFPANVAFAAILAGGIVLTMKSARERAPLVPYVIAFALPLLGALLYLPWPTIEGYYAAGVLPGLTLGLALALTRIGGASRAVRLVAGAAMLMIALYGGTFATSFIAAHRAAREVEAETARELARHSDARELIVGVATPRSDGPFADALRLYATAHGARDLPPGQEVSCEEAARLINAGTPGRVIVTFVPPCAEDAFANVRNHRTIRRAYVTREWKTLRPRVAESVAHLWRGE